MNPQWNTPPNGDFASYVERLSAQSAAALRAPVEGPHALDAGMLPSSEPTTTGPMSRSGSAWRGAASTDMPTASGVTDAARRLVASAARGLRAWAAEAARQQAQQQKQGGRKK